MEENYGSSMSVISSIFQSNYSPYGGAMSLYDSDIRVDNCSFADNWVSQKSVSMITLAPSQDISHEPQDRLSEYTDHTSTGDASHYQLKELFVINSFGSRPQGLID